MPAGVRAGATNPYQPVTSKPGTCSFIAGTSGSVAWRRGLVTASARTFPERTYGSADEAVANMNCTRPAIRSVMASAAPRYGTWTVFTPASTLSISPDKCTEVPLPDDEKLSPPGFALASATSSLTELAASDRVTTRMLGLDPTIKTRG